MRSFAATAALVLAGCAPQPGDLDADGRVDCRDLDGVFEAVSVRFTDLGDPARVVELDEVTLEFLLFDGVFRSRAVVGGAELRSSGRAYTDAAHALTVKGPLVPGAGPAANPLACDYVYGTPTGGAVRLRLEGRVGYDFPGDGVEGPVEAFLELAARRISG